MSSIRQRVQLTACAVALMASGAVDPATAQDVSVTAGRSTAAAPTAPRLRALARLAARRKAVEAERDQQRRAMGAAWFPETLQVGIFRIAAAPDLRAEVVPTVLALSREVEPSLDQRALDSLARWTLYVRRPMPEERGYLRGSSAVLSVAAGTNNFWGEGTAPFGLRAEVRAQLLELVRVTTSGTFDESLHLWLFNGRVSSIPPRAEVEQRARLDLATAESHVARRCVHGDFGMCASLLSLEGRPADPLRTWYAREDYRPLVSRIRLAPSDGRGAPQLQRRCLAQDDEACERLLASFEPARLPPPTSDAPRQVLLHEALRIGGAGAITRLRDARGAVGARLAAASGVSQDSLLASWHRRMVAERGASIRPAPTLALASLGWTLLLASLGLRRTRRCR